MKVKEIAEKYDEKTIKAAIDILGGKNNIGGLRKDEDRGLKTISKQEC